MIYPENGAALYAVENVIPYTKQGTGFVVGGAFTTTSGQPSRQLLPSTNTTMGYFPGCMLATCSGVLSGGGSSGKTAGAIINFDPNSTDTGQKVWNSLVIVDQGLKQPLPLVGLDGTTPYVYKGTIQVASKLQGWVIRQQYLYGPGTPTTDVTLVNTAVTSTSGISTVQSRVGNSSQNAETIFAY